MSLYIIDASAPIHQENIEHLQKLDREKTVIILNKVDKCNGEISDEIAETVRGFSVVKASLIDSSDEIAIKNALSEKLEGNIDFAAPPHAVISERHRQLLMHSQYEIKEGLELLNSGDDMQVSFVGQHLRAALELIGEATGKIYHDSLLDTIFSRFCVGK